MFIAGLGTATPQHRYTQLQCWEAFQGAGQFAQLDRRVRATLQRVLLNANGIRTRALALGALDEVFAADPDTLHRRFAEHAPVLASQAAADALQQADLRPRRRRGPHQHLHRLSLSRAHQLCGGTPEVEAQRACAGPGGSRLWRRASESAHGRSAAERAALRNGIVDLR